MVDQALISIFVSDNSEDELSEKVIGESKFENLNIYYSRNTVNIGSDKNIAKCYLYSDSEYVMILGDDDFLSENALLTILPILKRRVQVILFLRAFGLTDSKDYNRKDVVRNYQQYNSMVDVLLFRNIHLAFISSMIFKRDEYTSELVNKGVGTQLVQLNLVLYLLRKVKGDSLFIDANLVRSTRNNTGGYDPVDIFVVKFFKLLKEYNNLDMTKRQIYILKRKLLHTFYNRSLAQYMRKSGKSLSTLNIGLLDNFYQGMLVYTIFYRPMFVWHSSFSFYALSISYIAANIMYYPKMKTADFIYHLKNRLSK